MVAAFPEDCLELIEQQNLTCLKHETSSVLAVKTHIANRIPVKNDRGFSHGTVSIHNLVNDLSNTGLL